MDTIPRMASRIKFNAIVAMSDRTKGIGKNNALPWSIPEDHEYYKRVVATTRDPLKINAVIIGRVTWQSIPKDAVPIGPCLNVVVSSTLRKEDIECREGANRDMIVVCGSLAEARRVVHEQFADRVETIWSLGGADLYRLSFQSVDFHRLFLTRVFGDDVVECDVFLRPETFLDEFVKLKDEELTEERELYKCDYNVMKKEPNNGLEYIYEVYEKK